jgi:hypothetical protein
VNEKVQDSIIKLHGFGGARSESEEGPRRRTGETLDGDNLGKDKRGPKPRQRRRLAAWKDELGQIKAGRGEREGHAPRRRDLVLAEEARARAGRHEGRRQAPAADQRRRSTRPTSSCTPTSCACSRSRSRAGARPRSRRSTREAGDRGAARLRQIDAKEAEQELARAEPARLAIKLAALEEQRALAKGDLVKQAEIDQQIAQTKRAARASWRRSTSRRRSRSRRTGTAPSITSRTSSARACRRSSPARRRCAARSGHLPEHHARLRRLEAEGAAAPRGDRAREARDHDGDRAAQGGDRGGARSRVVAISACDGDQADRDLGRQRGGRRVRRDRGDPVRRSLPRADRRRRRARRRARARGRIASAEGGYDVPPGQPDDAAARRGDGAPGPLANAVRQMASANNPAAARSAARRARHTSTRSTRRASATTRARTRPPSPPACPRAVRGGHLARCDVARDE